MELSNDVLVFDVERQRQDRKNELKRLARRKRGLQKCGRKPNTDEQKEFWKQKRRERHKEWIIEYHEREPAKKLLWAAKRRAKLKGLEFSITEEDIIIPKHCPYLGLVLETQARRGTPRGNVISLDRIDPTKGYIPGNVEVMSQMANTMKNNASPEQLVKFAEEILRRYG